MFDFHEKRKIRNVLYSWPVVIVLLFLTVLLSVSAFDRYSVAKDMKVKLNVKEAELSEMEERAQIIESKVEYLKNERGIEEELRNNFDAIKEGEQAVIIIHSEEGKVDYGNTQSANADENITAEDETTFFDKILPW